MRAQQRHPHRDHSDQRQRQHSERPLPPADVLPDPTESYAEAKEREERQQLSFVLGEVVGTVALLPGGGSESQACHEGCDKPIAIDRFSPSERGDADRQCDQLAEHAVDPASFGCPHQHPATDETDQDSDEKSEPNRLDNERRDLTDRFGLAPHQGQADRHRYQRSDESVVQATFDVEGLPQLRRNTLISHHRLTEGGVRWSEDGPQHQSLHQGQPIDQEISGSHAGDHGQRKADAEQASRDLRVSSQCHEVDADGVGEQQEHEGGFGQDAEDAFVEPELHPVETSGADEPTCGHEDHRTAHNGSRQSLRHQPVENDDGGDGQERGHCLDSTEGLLVLWAHRTRKRPWPSSPNSRSDSATSRPLTTQISTPSSSTAPSRSHQSCPTRKD